MSQAGIASATRLLPSSIALALAEEKDFIDGMRLHAQRPCHYPLPAHPRMHLSRHPSRKQPLDRCICTMDAAAGLAASQFATAPKPVGRSIIPCSRIAPEPTSANPDKARSTHLASSLHACKKASSGSTMAPSRSRGARETSIPSLWSLGSEAADQARSEPGCRGSRSDGHPLWSLLPAPLGTHGCARPPFLWISSSSPVPQDMNRKVDRTVRWPIQIREVVHERKRLQIRIAKPLRSVHPPLLPRSSPSRCTICAQSTSYQLRIHCDAWSHPCHGQARSNAPVKPSSKGTCRAAHPRDASVCSPPPRRC